MSPATIPSVATIANELVALCRAGKNLEAIDRLYAADVVSIEPVGSEEMPAEMKGRDAIRNKNAWWFENYEVHRAEAHGPFIGDKQFAVSFDFDVTNKATGQRNAMTEMALYGVKDGRIVREQFFYHMPGA
jgi:ketosteroid isomerase-like protein